MPREIALGSDLMERKRRFLCDCGEYDFTILISIINRCYRDHEELDRLKKHLNKCPVCGRSLSVGVVPSAKELAAYEEKMKYRNYSQEQMMEEIMCLISC